MSSTFSSDTVTLRGANIFYRIASSQTKRLVEGLLYSPIE